MDGSSGVARAVAQPRTRVSGTIDLFHEAILWAPPVNQGSSCVALSPSSIRAAPLKYRDVEPTTPDGFEDAHTSWLAADRPIGRSMSRFEMSIHVPSG